MFFCETGHYHGAAARLQCDGELETIGQRSSEGRSGVKFVTMEIAGLDAAVRGFFQARDLGTPPSTAVFPGISQVAVLPKRFRAVSDAAVWLEETAEPGGNAVAVQVGPQQWLVGAWVEPA